MKRRLYFVSNSSSSSFVIIGIKLGKLSKAKKLKMMEDAKWEWDPEEYDSATEAFDSFVAESPCGDDNFSLFSGDDFDDLSENEYLVGECISNISSDDCGGSTCSGVSLKALLKIQEKLQKKFNLKARIYFGNSYKFC